jgi:hypothetical protein
LEKRYIACRRFQLIEKIIIACNCSAHLSSTASKSGQKRAAVSKISLSNQRLPFLKLMTTIAVAYQGFLDEEKAGDSPELRSEFRVTWWQKAEAGDIHIW